MQNPMIEATVRNGREITRVVARNIMFDLKDQEGKARGELGELMDREGVTSFTDQATGRNVHFRTNRQHVIADPDLVRSSLQQIGELDSCLKLDPAAVKKVLKQHPNLAGMEEQVTQSLVVGPKGGK